MVIKLKQSRYCEEADRKQANHQTRMRAPATNVSEEDENFEGIFVEQNEQRRQNKVVALTSPKKTSMPVV